MIGRLLCALGRHDWSAWVPLESPYLGRREARVCYRRACRGRTRRRR